MVVMQGVNMVLVHGWNMVVMQGGIWFWCKG